MVIEFADLSNDDLIREWQEAEQAFDAARRIKYACEGELLRRMGPNLSLQADAGIIVRSPVLGTYQWDRDALHKLFGDRLHPVMWDEIEHESKEIKVSTRAVQKYAKKLGIPEAELNKCYFRAESRQDLEFVPGNLEQQLRDSVEAANGN